MMTNPLTLTHTPTPAEGRSVVTYTFTVYPPGFLGDDDPYYHTYVQTPRQGEFHLGGTHTRVAALALVDEHMLAIERDIDEAA